ncbi:MAG: thiamine pyrophosphate-binding protein [Microvirga sp.]|jgi:acetolactate synthase I/II/III large subunit
MQPRGADVVARALERAGARTVFTLSGNHIMPIFDAVLETGLRLVHCRHEAAAVHMADAWARVTGACGVALVTGGPGHANAVPALYTALAAESPVVLLSGHASLGEIGRGSFQEMRQAELAEPVAKASWTVRSASELEGDVERAFRLAMSGRPGPVHVSLPFDVLEAAPAVADQQMGLAPADSAGRTLSELELRSVLAALASAERPLILAGPLLCRLAAGEGLARLGAALKVPAIGMESPRGVNDPSLGAFADLLPRADLILLLGKKHDFTLRFAEPPFVDANCRFMVIDPEAEAVERVAREKRDRLVLSVLADPAFAADQLSKAGSSRHPGDAWYSEAARAIAYRPPEWEAPRSSDGGGVDPVTLCQTIDRTLREAEKPLFICDGGEVGQWGQCLVSTPRRIINGVAGSIGAAIPFALGARAADPQATIIALSGDGAFGFHMTEFDTAVRYGLAFVAVIGNDAAWNAEHQMQLRTYGAQRAHGCELLRTRYDDVVKALGGHGELVTTADQLLPALERAIGSGKPACVNVLVPRVAAPVVRLPA